jgi:hypothetical protein
MWLWTRGAISVRRRARNGAAATVPLGAQHTAAAGGDAQRRSASSAVGSHWLPLAFPSVCVWGANTGVGKTLVSAGLARAAALAKVGRGPLAPAGTAGGGLRWGEEGGEGAACGPSPAGSWCEASDTRANERPA